MIKIIPRETLACWCWLLTSGSKTVTLSPGMVTLTVKKATLSPGTVTQQNLLLHREREESENHVFAARPHLSLRQLCLLRAATQMFQPTPEGSINPREAFPGWEIGGWFRGALPRRGGRGWFGGLPQVRGSGVVWGAPLGRDPTEEPAGSSLPLPLSAPVVLNRRSPAQAVSFPPGRTAGLRLQ